MKLWTIALAAFLTGCATSTYLPQRNDAAVNTVHQNASYVVRSIAQVYGVRVQFDKDVDTVTTGTCGRTIIIIGKAPLRSILSEIENGYVSFKVYRGTIYVSKPEEEHTATGGLMPMDTRGLNTH